MLRYYTAKVSPSAYRLVALNYQSSVHDVFAEEVLHQLVRESSGSAQVVNVLQTPPGTELEQTQWRNRGWRWDPVREVLTEIINRVGGSPDVVILTGSPDFVTAKRSSLAKLGIEEKKIVY
ncbi:hypothetical protein HDU93_008576 [Gonapodya sp. JEL0774]|nr:hypothetical protein HDU93_008576 [Gonapodya sp. JEL0774]